MFNYGLDGDETLLHESQYPQQDFLGDEEPSPRGEEHSPLVGFLSSHLLRIGFTLQTTSLAFMFVFYLAFGGSGIFVFDLYAGPESVRISSAFHFTISVLTAIYLLGTIYVAMFQVFVADNSKWCRGFRAGSKILSAAVTLDLVSTSLRLVQYLYAYFYMSIKWWARYQQTKADWSLFNVGNVLNSVALCMYGAAIFYMEAYHDEGTFEEFAWTNLVLFKLAALSELMMVFTGYGAFFTLFLLAAMVTATLWAYSFEPLLEKWSPELHSRDLNVDVVPEVKDTTDGSSGPGEPTYTASSVPTNLGDYSTAANVNLPTEYDYTQMQQQVSEGVELGVVGSGYPHYQ